MGLIENIFYNVRQVGRISLYSRRLIDDLDFAIVVVDKKWWHCISNFIRTMFCLMSNLDLEQRQIPWQKHKYHRVCNFAMFILLQIADSKNQWNNKTTFPRNLIIFLLTNIYFNRNVVKHDLHFTPNYFRQFMGKHMTLKQCWTQDHERKLHVSVALVHSKCNTYKKKTIYIIYKMIPISY